MVDELGDVVDVTDGSLKLIGRRMDDKLREAMILEAHLARINALASQNLGDLEHRNNLKCALRGLESFLFNLHDTEYKTEITKVKAVGMSDVNTEITKCFQMYDALKGLISRTVLYKKSEPIYSTEE